MSSTDDQRTDTRRPRGTARTKEALRTSGYVAVGLGDAAVDAARTIGSVSQRLPHVLRRTPEVLASGVRRGYEDLTERGREVTGSAKRDPRVREAQHRTEVAASQTKGAATAARNRAGEATSQAKGAATAARRSADEAGSQAKGAATAARNRAGEAASPAKGAATSTRKAASAQAEAARSTASKLGSDDTGTGDLEDRTVVQLRNRAAELGIEGRTQLNKKDLIAAIRDAQ